MIPQYKPIYGEKVKENLIKLVESDSWLSEFKETENFENQIKSKTGNKYAIAVNNGTMALSLALYGVGVRAGDEVIVPNLTMIATANAVRFIGAIPVFCDVEQDTGCLSCMKAEFFVTKKTKAVIYVTLNGRINAKGVLNLREFCKNENIVFIKDDAQSLGSCINGDSIQDEKFGDIHTLSFSPHKLISTGQGGMVLTDNEEYYKIIKRLKDFGRLEGGADVHDYFGINNKFTDLQSVVGLAQIEDFEDRVIHKRKIYEYYYNHLCGDNEQTSFTMFKRNLYHTPWFVDLYVEDRDNLISYLKNYGIGTRKMYPVISEEKCYSETYTLNGDREVAKQMSDTGIWLPSSFDLTTKDLEFITQKIRYFYSE